MNGDEDKRGFARMTPERHRTISSEGGRKVHAFGRGHVWTRETARVARERCARSGGGQ